MEIQGRSIEIIFETKKVRNAFWDYVMLSNGKYALFMNKRLQRIFTNASEARTWFEIETSK